MSGPITITGDLSRMRSDLSALGTRAPLAARRALNRTLDSAGTQATRAIAGQVGRGVQKYIRKALGKKRASGADLRAELRITDVWIPAIRFKATASGFRLGKGRRGVSPTFKATMPSGHRGLFQRIAERGRRGNPNLQRIAQLFGPSVPQLVLGAGIDVTLRQSMQTNLTKNLAHEASFLVRGR